MPPFLRSHNAHHQSIDTFVAYLKKEVTKDYANVVATTTLNKNSALQARYINELKLESNGQQLINANMQQWVFRLLCTSCFQQELNLSQKRQLTITVKCAILQTLHTTIVVDDLKIRFQPEFDRLFKTV